jgi:two-component system, chemotaxis family, sensor kinase Cph1
MTETPRFGQADLTDCDREPIHLPGSIQPHGCLVVLHPDTHEIIQTAGDVAAFFDTPGEHVLGRALSKIIGETAAAKILKLVQSAHAGLLPRKSTEVTVTVGAHKVDAIIHLSHQFPVVEFESLLNSGLASSELMIAMERILSTLDAAEGIRGYCQAATEQIRALTGFDRVMLYRFLSDGSGVVVAEDRREGIDSYLDLRYPESDIPKQARELYRKNWVRLIPNVDYIPAPLNPEINPVSGEPLDMSFCTLRSVSPIHIEYLKNMGVAASMSISIVQDEALWGLIACHHLSPHSVPCEVRAACEVFGRVFSSHLKAREKAEDSGYRLRQSEIYSRLVNRFSTMDVLAEGLFEHRSDLLEYIRAEGVVTWIDGKSARLGVTPPEAFIKALIDWLNEQDDTGVFATNQLAKLYPPARAHAETASGLLALAVSRMPRDYILWFRSEVVETVTWAGDPNKAIQSGPNGDRLTPRRSFAAWREQVRFQAAAWKQVEIEAANALRVVLLEVVLLRIDQIARERARAQEHQDLLLCELDHRVKNTLATIQALMRQSREGSDTLDSYVTSLEHRINSMAHAHSLLSQNRWEGAELDSLIEEELKPYADTPSLHLTACGPRVTLKPKAALSISMVIHELATNAAKYGSLSREGGRLDVAWWFASDDDGEALVVRWTEGQGPPVATPSRSGFGRLVIEQSLAYELEGEVALSFDPQGVRCLIRIPAEHVGKSNAPTESVRIQAPSMRGERPRRILVVEDSMLTALDLATILRKRGYEIVGPVGRLSEAMSLAQTETLDGAILDINLGDDDSFGVADTLEFRGIPFVFLSGYEASHILPRRFGHKVVVAKPFSETDLDTALTAAAQAT